MTNSKEMKGKSTFTLREVEEIRRLLRTKATVGRAEQKRARHVLRNKLAFFITDFTQRKPFSDADLDDLLRSGRITIVTVKK